MMTGHAWRMMTTSLGGSSVRSEASLRFTVVDWRQKNNQVQNVLSDTCSQDVSGLKLCPEQSRIQPAQALHHCGHAAGQASSPVFVSDCEQHGMQQALFWLLFAPLVLLWAPQELYQNTPSSWVLVCCLPHHPGDSAQPHTGKWRKLRLSAPCSLHWGIWVGWE